MLEANVRDLWRKSFYSLSRQIKYSGKPLHKLIAFGRARISYLQGHCKRAMIVGQMGINFKEQPQKSEREVISPQLMRLLL